jgi:TAT (twin-arginine translocation) pathway signal sequence
MKRRTFLKSGLATAAVAVLPDLWSQAPDATAWRKTWDAALAVLAGNVKVMPKFDQPVLQEGSVYRGTWMECGPHESLAYAQLAQFVTPVDAGPSPLQVAINTHRAFFANQREDGQLPANITKWGVGWSMIQMVVPIAATAWEVAQIAKDEAFLSYESEGPAVRPEKASRKKS